MTTLEKVRELLAELTPGEKSADLAVGGARDLTSVIPGVESSPDVAGGGRLAWYARGIPVWVLVQAPAGLAAARLKYLGRPIRRCGPRT